MDNFNHEKNIRKIQGLLDKVNKKKEQVREFLYPNELEEYDALELKEKDGDLSVEERKKIHFYRFLADGMSRDKAERIAELQSIEGDLSRGEREELRFLRFYKQLVLETNKGFLEKDAQEYFNLTIKEEREGVDDIEKEKLLFYRWVTNEDAGLSKDEAFRLAKLQMMSKYNLLGEDEEEELRQFYLRT